MCCSSSLKCLLKAHLLTMAFNSLGNELLDVYLFMPILIPLFSLMYSTLDNLGCICAL